MGGEREPFFRKVPSPSRLFYPNPLTGFILPVGEQGDLAGLVQRHADPRHGFAGLVGDFDVPGFGLFGTADFNVHLVAVGEGFLLQQVFFPVVGIGGERGTAYKYHTEHR